MYEAMILNKYTQGQIKGIVVCDECFYMPVRITGLGENLRFGDGTLFVENRDKIAFLSNEAMAHFGNLPIIINHPKESLLNSENLAENRIIGNTINAFFKDDEIWGIARIFDKSILEKLNNGIYSTSPAIKSFHSQGTRECPLVINHLAFVDKGHWDKDGKKAYDDSQITFLIYDLKGGENGGDANSSDSD